MKRGLLVVSGTFFVVASLFMFRTSTQAEEQTLWSGGFTAEIVEDSRKFLNGHPCEEQALKWVKRTRPYWGASTYQYSYDVQTDPRCGVYTDFGFTDGMAYAMNDDGGKAYHISGSPTHYLHYPSNITIHRVKAASLSSYYRLSYYTGNMLGDTPDIYMGSNGTLTKNTGNITAEARPLRFADSNALMTRSFGVSENGQFIAIVDKNKGVFVYDVLRKTYTTVSLRTAGTREGNTGSISVSNDGNTILHYDTNMNRIGGSGQSKSLLVYDATNCMQTLSAEEFLEDVAFSSEGCREIDLTSRAQDVVDATTKLISTHDPYVHPRGSYVQAKFVVEPTGEAKQNKIIRFTPTNAPEARGYVAMGDSFSSGEGDLQGGQWYEPGTDEQGDKGTFSGRNLCHVSRRSYPYLLAKRLGFMPGNESMAITPSREGEFHSVACSGAVLHNVVGGALYGEDQSAGGSDDFAMRDNQYRFNENITSLEWQQGVSSQVKALNGDVFAEIRTRDFSPEIITLGIGGNDAGFGDKIQACSLPGTCPYAVPGTKEAESVALEIANLKYRLREAYKKVKREAPESAKIYVHGYPRFINASGDFPCYLNTPFDSAEVTFIDQGIIYMNSVIEAAAKEAGVYYVDISNALQGFELCSGVRKENSMFNGATVGNDINNFFFGSYCMLRTGCLGNESFHPTPSGHIQYASTIQAQTANFTATMPETQTTLIPLPGSYFGDDAIMKVSQMNTSRISFEPLSFPLIYSDRTFAAPIEEEAALSVFSRGFAPNSTVIIEVHSDPIQLGEFATDDNGQLQTEVELPEGLEPGLHTLHVFGIDSFGQPIDAYTSFYKGLEQGDFDGDGVPDEVDSCPTIVNASVDIDSDGIDDACDIDTFVETQEQEEQPDEGEVLGDNTDLDLIKGQPNEETVAGTEDELGDVVVDGEVLGASTDIPSAELSQTGQPIIVAALVGASVIISVIIVRRKPRVYYAKKH